MMKQKADSVGALTKGIEFLFKKNKADWIKGKGRIWPARARSRSPPPTERVTTLAAKDIVIATGSEPTPLPGVDFVEGKVIDSTGALSLPAIPKHLIVVGAGVIGLELGSVWRRLGAEVTVVEFLDKVGAGMDAEVATAFQRSLTKQGMTFKMGTKVTGEDGQGRRRPDAGARRRAERPRP
jgi:dihydrolipoamide dehydrogenase